MFPKYSPELISLNSMIFPFSMCTFMAGSTSVSAVILYFYLMSLQARMFTMDDGLYHSFKNQEGGPVDLNLGSCH